MKVSRSIAFGLAKDKQFGDTGPREGKFNSRMHFAKSLLTASHYPRSVGYAVIIKRRIVD